MRAFAVLVLCLALPALADDEARLSIKDHRFTPARLEVPAGVRFKLVVRNEGAETIEWESYELNREKRVKAGQEETIFLGPLSAGEYDFVDDLDQDTKGVLVAR